MPIGTSGRPRLGFDASALSSAASRRRPLTPEPPQLDWHTRSGIVLANVIGERDVAEPLEGFTVVEMTVAVQGPAAGLYLRDMGAEVIKV